MSIAPMLNRKRVCSRSCENFRQIARIQNASLYTIQGRYRYGMKRLRVLLDGEETT